jgi:hypothetical protein
VPGKPYFLTGKLANGHWVRRAESASVPFSPSPSLYFVSARGHDGMLPCFQRSTAKWDTPSPQVSAFPSLPCSHFWSTRCLLWSQMFELIPQGKPWLPAKPPRPTKPQFLPRSCTNSCFLFGPVTFRPRYFPAVFAQVTALLGPPKPCFAVLSLQGQ